MTQKARKALRYLSHRINSKLGEKQRPSQNTEGEGKPLKLLFVTLERSEISQISHVSARKRHEILVSTKSCNFKHWWWTHVCVCIFCHTKKADYPFWYEEIWHSPMTKVSIPTENQPVDNTKTPPKSSITQRLQTDLGRSVVVTTTIQRMWLNIRFMGNQPSCLL